MKRKIFNIIQIGDKSNRVSRAFDIFITITIFANILVTFLQTFEELSRFSLLFHWVEGITLANLLCGVCTSDLDGGLSLPEPERMEVAVPFFVFF